MSFMTPAEADRRSSFDCVTALLPYKGMLPPSKFYFRMRGVVAGLSGLWQVVGITPAARAHMEAKGWGGKYVKDLRRDHIRPLQELIDELAADPDLNFERFCALVSEYGHVIVTTRAENPTKGSGCGSVYSIKDVLWLSEPYPSESLYGVPKATELYRTATAREAGHVD